MTGCMINTEKVRCQSKCLAFDTNGKINQKKATHHQGKIIQTFKFDLGLQSDIVFVHRL